MDGILNFGAPGNDDVLNDGVHIVTSPGLDGMFGTADDRDVFSFDNVAPDAGLSAPFNAVVRRSSASSSITASTS